MYLERRRRMVPMSRLVGAVLCACAVMLSCTKTVRVSSPVSKDMEISEEGVYKLTTTSGVVYETKSLSRTDSTFVVTWLWQARSRRASIWEPVRQQPDEPSGTTGWYRVEPVELRFEEVQSIDRVVSDQVRTTNALVGGTIIAAIGAVALFLATFNLK
jgi:hypothetical protein